MPCFIKGSKKISDRLNKMLFGLFLNKLKTKNMKSFTLLFAIVCTLVYQASAEKHTITNSGNAFIPGDISIAVGDTVIFDITSTHNAVEVSQSTWDANGKTKNGGFTVPYGGGSLDFKQAGTYYYVCEPHASMGMKGIIRVGEPTGIKKTNTVIEGAVFPNPAGNYLTISYSLEQKANVNISLLSITGKTIAVIYQNELDSGSQHIEYNIDNSIPSGVYFIKIMTGDGYLVKKIIVAKNN
jgi:plastocyanin